MPTAYILAQVCIVIGILTISSPFPLKKSFFALGTQNTSSQHLREVGPPPNAKRRQTMLNRLCSVCAGLCCKNFRLCCFGFLDIKRIFLGHSEVT